MADPVDLLARFRRPAAAAPLLAPVPNLVARAELVPEYERMPEAPRPLLEVAEELLQQPGGLEAVRAAYVPYVCRASFARFCREAWTPTVEPSTQLVWGWQHELMAATLQALFFDWLRAKMSPPQKKHLNAVINTVFNVCPGSLKSRIVSVFFPAWIWLHDPGFKFICLSVNEEAALRDARAMRTVIRSEWYQETFQPKWSLKGDQDAISNFGNTKGGERLSKASGSEVVGLRGDCTNAFISTELGDIHIRDLHEKFQSGQSVPRIWTLNEQTGETELKQVLMSRKITGREIVTVHASGYSLDCTRDHKIYTDGIYTSAEHVLGCNLSVLPRGDWARTRRSPSEMSRTQVRESDVRQVCEAISASGLRARSSDAARELAGVLLKDLCNSQCEHWEIPQRSDTSSTCDDVRRVSDMRRSYLPESQESATEMHGMQVCRSDLRALRPLVSEIRGGVRQTCATRADQWSFLFEEVHDGGSQRSLDLDGVQSLRQIYSSSQRASREELLFEELPSGGRAESRSSTSVPDLFGRVCDEVPISTDMLEEMRWASAVDGCSRETVGNNSLRAFLATPRSPDSRTRSLEMCDLQRVDEFERTSCTSYRSRYDEQFPRESNHTLYELSLYTPQIARTPVLFVDDPLSRGESRKADVYDLQVEGNHNFFANGVLVHNCILMDDPNNPQSSFSKRDRDEVNSLWQHNQSNRVNDVQRSLRIIVQQRVNEHDLTGFVLSRDGVWSPENRYGWLHLVLPAEYDPARKFVLPQELRAVLGELALTGIPLEDPRTVSGESVDPIRMPPSYLESERKRTEGTGFYTSQMLQRPSAAEGAMVKREWFSFFELDAGVRAGIDRLEGGRPRPDGCHAGRAELVGALMHSPGEFNFDETILSIDCAAKETTQGSEWGLLAMARRGGRRYVLDRRTQRGDILTIFKIICELIDEWGVTKVLVEDRAAGPDLRVRLMTEIGEGTLTPVELVMVKVATGKIERTMSALPTMASGMLSLRDGATWLEPFVDAVCGFPAWPTDDDIDCLTQAINYWADTEENVGGYSIVGCG